MFIARYSLVWTPWMATTRSPTGIRLNTAEDAHREQMSTKTRTANTQRLTQREKLLVSISAASGTPAPPSNILYKVTEATGLY